MQNIILRGFGFNQKIITRGYGGLLQWIKKLISNSFIKGKPGFIVGFQLGRSIQPTDGRKNR